MNNAYNIRSYVVFSAYPMLIKYIYKLYNILLEFTDNKQYKLTYRWMYAINILRYRC